MSNDVKQYLKSKTGEYREVCERLQAEIAKALPDAESKVWHAHPVWFLGGNHRVPKAEFQAVLESLGFRDVMIYINSGNAVFTSDDKVSAGAVQTALEKHFGFSIPTLVLPGEKVRAIAAAIPPEWTNDAPRPDKSGQKSDVLYLFDELNAPDVLEKLGYNPSLETMIYIDGAVLANITRANQLKGSLQKLVGTKLYAQMTVRNVNTARKLAELVKINPS